MTEQEQQAIEKAANVYAEKHGFRVPYDGSNDFYDTTDVKASKEGFLEGAQYAMSELCKPDGDLVDRIEEILHRYQTESECPECDTYVPYKSIQQGDYKDVATEIATLIKFGYLHEAIVGGSHYVRKDISIEFATRFYQLMTSARVDEYIGARKDVCVNDLFDEFIKSKADERP